MHFKFINYISPTWYFNLKEPFGKIPYCIDFSKLSQTEQEALQIDYSYSSEGVSKLDAAYQAWRCGIIKTDPSFQLELEEIQPTLFDEYYFIKRHYKYLWSVYILIIRIVTLKNPFRELAAFLNARKVKVDDLTNASYIFGDYDHFQSELLMSNPLISIIIPTLNRYHYLKNILEDLECQDYRNFEVIIVDQSDNFNPDFYKNFKLSITLIRQSEKALWSARNNAIRMANAKLIAFSEDDVRVPKNWLSNHIKGLDYFKADISTGVFFPAGTQIPKERNFFRWADQFSSGNALLVKEVFFTTGLFDRQFEKQRMGDGEFGLRAYLSGFKSISNPFAWCEDVKAPEGGLRQLGSWDSFRPKKLFSPRPIPSVNYLTRKYFGNANAIYNIILNVPASIVPYKYKGSRMYKYFGIIIFVIGLPIMLIPIIRSWIISSQMLKEGAKIDTME